MKKWTLAMLAGFTLFTTGIHTSYAIPQYPPPGPKSDKPPIITQTMVQQWIKAQGKEKDYYFHGFQFKLVNLDQDKDLEIVATIDGGVHLGNFFVMDYQAGNYKLIAERKWKVEEVKTQPLTAAGEKAIFETVERTGGTGIDMKIAHLWYVDKGAFHEAWEWTTKNRSSIPGSGNLITTVGGYQVADEPELQLYAWSTTHLLDVEPIAPEANTPQTTMQIFKFDGEKFVPSQDEPYSALLRFLNEKTAAQGKSQAGPALPAFGHVIVEKELQTGRNWSYQVLLVGGTDKETTLKRAKITVVKQAEKWQVSKVDLLK